LIPNSGFIDESADPVLLTLALARLAELDFVDILENVAMRSRLFAWLHNTWGLTFWSKLERRLNGPPRRNSNEAKPPLFGEHRPMATELANGAAELLLTRSRLDSALWRHIAQTLPNGKKFLAREQSYYDTTRNRYDELLLLPSI
jgi:hypothetical protein